MPRTFDKSFWLDLTIFEFAFGVLKTALDARDEVVIVVDTSCRVELAFLDVYSGITYAGALRPLLMPFVARQAASARRTSRALVLLRFGVTVGRSAAA